MKPEQARKILSKEPAATFLDGEDATVVITHQGTAEFIVGEPTIRHALSDLRTMVEQAEQIEALEKSLRKTKADAFFEVGDLLKNEYEGSYDRPSIEDFFYDKAQELLGE